MKRVCKVFSIILISAVFSACLKDKGVIGPEAPGYISNIVEFKNPDFISSPVQSRYPLYVKSFENVPEAQLPLTVSYSGADVAPQDINVTVGLDNDVLSVYNEDNDKAYVPLPESVYSVDSYNVTIPKGQREATITINLKPDQMDFEAQYGLAFTIESASYGEISGNFGTVVLSILPRNEYDGLYSYSGSILRYVNGTPDPGLSGDFTNLSARALASTDKYSNSLVPLWVDGSGIAGIDNTYLTVDPETNLVTVACETNPSLHNTPGAVNKYDPATKTFTLAFEWGDAPNQRVTTMTLTYTGPR